MKHVLLVLALLLSCAVIPAHADPTWTLVGTATMLGTDACGGQCVQTLNFSFQVTWEQYAYSYDPSTKYILDPLPGGTATGSGPLGTDWNLSPTYWGDVASNPAGDSFWLEFGDSYQGPSFAPTPSTFPPPLWGYQEGCGSEACMIDFVDANWTGGTPTVHFQEGDAGIGYGGTFQYTVTGPHSPHSTPESGTLGFLALPSALLLWGTRRRRRIARAL